MVIVEDSNPGNDIQFHINKIRGEERTQRWQGTKWVGFYQLEEGELTPPEAWDDALTRAFVYNGGSKAKSTI